MLFNTGNQIVKSTHGMLTTVAYKFGEKEAKYALEGSIAIAGAAVKWIRDNMGIIQSSSEIEAFARKVEDPFNAGVFFVPAFTGLFAPYWRNDARGFSLLFPIDSIRVIVGLTQYSNRNHIARATLEATCFQTREVKRRLFVS